MKSDDERKSAGERPPDAKPKEPQKRFRIERLEERIAPKKGGNGTNNCPGSSGRSVTSFY